MARSKIPPPASDASQTANRSSSRYFSTEFSFDDSGIFESFLVRLIHGRCSCSRNHPGSASSVQSVISSAPPSSIESLRILAAQKENTAQQSSPLTKCCFFSVGGHDPTPQARSSECYLCLPHFFLGWCFRMMTMV